MTTTNINTEAKTMSSNINTPFDFAGSLFHIITGRRASTWVSELPGRLEFTRESIDPAAKTMVVRVNCPGRFDEGFETIVNYTDRHSIYAAVDIIQTMLQTYISKARSDKALLRTSYRSECRFARIQRELDAAAK